MVDADHLYAADPHWWKYHIADIARDFEGKCWSCETPGRGNWGTLDPAAWGVTTLECEIAGQGLSLNPKTLIGGSNSGYQAIGLAHKMLPDGGRIILLGYDMGCHEGRSHWFGDHPKRFNSNVKYERFIEAFRTIKPADYGLEILNCSRRTALDAFPIHNLDDLF